jgi:hypothetical protein
LIVRDPVLLGILLLAAGLRLYGLDHGLPFVYNPDEANIMARSLSIAQGPDPGYYLYPSFFFYLLFAVMGVLFVLGRASGRYESVADFQMRFFENPTDFYLAGRLVGVVAALGTIVLTYRLVERHFSRTAARGAALIVAVAYFNVRDAHYLKHDVPCGLLAVGALWAIDRAIERKTAWAYALAGVVTGVGFATHYYLIFLAPAFAVAHFTARRFEGFRALVLAGAVSAATFFLLTPFVLLNLGTAIEHMGANRRVVVDRSIEGEGAATFLPSFDDYLDFLATQGLGYGLLVLVFGGFVLMARFEARRLAIWGFFPLVFFLFISYTFFAGRYLNPMLPFMAAAGGFALAFLEERVRRGLGYAVAILVSVQPLYRSYHVGRLFDSVDTRTVARAFVLSEYPMGGTLALQSYSVPVPQSAESIRAGLTENGALSELDRQGKYASLVRIAEAEETAFDLVFFGAGDEPNRIYVSYEELREDLSPLRRRGVNVVVLRIPPATPPPEVEAVFRRVREEGELVQRIAPSPPSADVDTATTVPYLDNEDWPPSASLERKGPTIEIWSLVSR